MGSLQKSNQVSEAAVVQKQAISLYRNLAQAGSECMYLLCATLHNYGHSCYVLRQHAEAVLAYQECIFLWHPLAAANPEEEIYLISALHDIANSFHALGKHADANAAANEALERNHGKVKKSCNYALDFKACFVCQRAMMMASIEDPSSPLPFFLTSSPQPAEHPGACAVHTPAETSTSPHMPPTNAARQMGPDQPGVAPEAPGPAHLDPTAPFPRAHPPTNLISNDRRTPAHVPQSTLQRL